MNLTIILIACLWVMYGLFAIAQAKEYIDRKDKKYEDSSYQHSPGEYRGWTAFLYVVIAPGLFIAKALYGAFKRYK
jgi:hypothetical protein